MAAAVALADAEGLAAVSMRRVAAELGVAAMTLYGHVPGKGELVDLMLDAVLGELYPDEQALDRRQLARPASRRWPGPTGTSSSATRGRCTWPPAGRRSGPDCMRKYELELRAVDGLGLSEVQMDLLVTLVNGFVRGTVGGVHEKADAERVTGISEDQWWAATAPYVAQVFDPERFPTAARVGPVAGEELPAPSPRERSFEFGLERLLDGIGVLILNPSR